MSELRFHGAARIELTEAAIYWMVYAVAHHHRRPGYWKDRVT